MVNKKKIRAGHRAKVIWVMPRGRNASCSSSRSGRSGRSKDKCRRWQRRNWDDEDVASVELVGIHNFWNLGSRVKNLELTALDKVRYDKRNIELRNEFSLTLRSTFKDNVIFFKRNWCGFSLLPVKHFGPWFLEVTNRESSVRSAADFVHGRQMIRLVAYVDERVSGKAFVSQNLRRRNVVSCMWRYLQIHWCKLRSKVTTNPAMSFGIDLRHVVGLLRFFCWYVGPFDAGRWTIMKACFVLYWLQVLLIASFLNSSPLSLSKTEGVVYDQRRWVSRACATIVADLFNKGARMAKRLKWSTQTSTSMEPWLLRGNCKSSIATVSTGLGSVQCVCCL